MLERRTAGPACFSSPGDATWPTPQGYSKGKDDNNVPGITPLDIAARPDLAHLRKDWRTPIAEDSECRTANGTLTDAVRSWPTPNTRDAHAAGRHTTTTGVMHPGTTLTDAAREWASSMPSDVTGGRTTKGSQRPDETGLRRQALDDWLTPQSRDHKGISQKIAKGQYTGGLPDQLAGLHDQASGNTRGNPPASSPRPVLNPRWVETLMAFPANWLDVF